VEFGTNCVRVDPMISALIPIILHSVYSLVIFLIVPVFESHLLS